MQSGPRRGGCKELVVHGLGGWSVGFEAALTSYEAVGKSIKYSERSTKRYDDGSHGTYVGLRLLLLQLAAVIMVVMAAGALPPQMNRCRWQREETRGENTRSPASCRVRGVGSVLSVSAQPVSTTYIFDHYGHAF